MTARRLGFREKGADLARIFQPLLSSEATACPNICPAVAGAFTSGLMTKTGVDDLIFTRVVAGELASGLAAKPPGGFVFSPHFLPVSGSQPPKRRPTLAKNRGECEKCGLGRDGGSRQPPSRLGKTTDICGSHRARSAGRAQSVRKTSASCAVASARSQTRPPVVSQSITRTTSARAPAAGSSSSSRLRARRNQSASR